MEIDYLKAAVPSMWKQDSVSVDHILAILGRQL